jgi:hypothetical protein
MAVSFVAVGAVATGANPTVAVPAGYAAGDTLIIVTTGTATTTTPSGWTLLSAQGSGTFSTIFYKTATASESSVALTNAGTSTIAVMIDYRGVSSLQPVASYSTTLTTNTLTTPTANAYVLSVYAAGAPIVAGTWTAPASTTVRVNTPGVRSASAGLLIVDELQVAAGISTARTAGLTQVGGAISTVAISLNPPYYLNISGVTIGSGVTLGG